MRLIDADALLLDNTWECFDGWGNYTGAGQIIADAPTIDAVEVVRCKDCRWYRDTFFRSKVNPYCVKEFDEEFGALRGGITEDSFCSYGEKVKP